MAEAFYNFGKDLRKAREKKGLTRAALAEIVNIVPRYINNIENYGSLPSISVFYRLIKACDMPVEQYFYPERTAEPERKERNIMEKMRFCPEEYVPVIEAIVEAAVDSLREFEISNLK